MRISTAFLVVVAGLAGVPAQETAPRDATEEVREIVASHAVAVQSGDFATLDKLYSDDPDMLIVESGGANRGWAEYRDHHLKPELKELKEFAYKYESVDAEVAGDAAWATFDYKLHAVAKGNTIDVAGKGTMVLRRHEGAWKIVHSHTSSRPRKP